MNLNHRTKLIVTMLFMFITVIYAHNACALQFTVVTSTGKTVAMTAQPDETIADVKEFLFDVTGIHQGTQRIYKGSELLEDNRTLASYNISDNDTLRVRLGAGNAGAGSGKTGGGALKIFIILAVLAVIVLAAKKILFGKGTPEETQE